MSLVWLHCHQQNESGKSQDRPASQACASVSFSVDWEAWGGWTVRESRPSSQGYACGLLTCSPMADEFLLPPLAFVQTLLPSLPPPL